MGNLSYFLLNENLIKYRFFSVYIKSLKEENFKKRKREQVEESHGQNDE